MQWPMDVDFVKYLSGKSSKLLKVKHHDIPNINYEVFLQYRMKKVCYMFPI